MKKDFPLADIRQAADSLMVPYINLYTVYFAQGMNESNEHDYYWKTDLHHNSKGYALWARAVAEKISTGRMLN